MAAKNAPKKIKPAVNGEKVHKYWSLTLN
jgi:hypothetical protein